MYNIQIQKYIANKKFYFTYKLNANVHKKKPCYRHYVVVTSEVNCSSRQLCRLALHAFIFCLTKL